MCYNQTDEPVKNSSELRLSVVEMRVEADKFRIAFLLPP